VAPRRLLLVGVVALVTFTLDRVTKMWVEQNVPLFTARPVVGDYVRIVHTQNTGAAFGLLPERTTLLSVLSVLAVAMMAGTLDLRAIRLVEPAVTFKASWSD